MIPSSLRQRWLVIMLAGATLVSATLGIRQVFGLFLQPISIELGTGFQLFSLAIAVQNLVWGLSSPLFGAAADRYGPWRVAAIGALLYGGGLFLMSSYVTEAGIFIGQILIGLGLGSAGISIAIGAVARAAPQKKDQLQWGLSPVSGHLGSSRWCR